MGCGSLAPKDIEPRVYRYQTLVALQLSSQTKDPVTAAAVARLREGLQGGLCIEGMCAVDDETLTGLIYGVGFHRRKTIYLKETAKLLRDQYGGDIPPDLEGLMSLPGVGPKMAYLAMQCAWDKNDGVGVDVHVHRIAGRLGWTKRARDPEDTRMQLESWLPKEKWAEINPMLVGFGQTVCAATPKCDGCPVASLCPKIGTKKKS
ncbi:DNA N-glycosylase and apurinic/apyrimidinic (AP) lyase [Irineochytrium annulatum]|nr:DNA N-glycosylase and apurinic/apyrimidinic (AP) lyase [Irineochytrium annulatum]